MSDAPRNVRLYSRIKDRKSPLKGSRPSVPHGTNFFTFIFDVLLPLLVYTNIDCRYTITFEQAKALRLGLGLIISRGVSSTLSSKYKYEYEYKYISHEHNHENTFSV